MSILFISFLYKLDGNYFCNKCCTVSNWALTDNGGMAELCNLAFKKWKMTTSSLETNSGLQFPTFQPSIWRLYLMKLAWPITEMFWSLIIGILKNSSRVKKQNLM